MNTIQNGVWSGILATGPMTLAMFGMQKELPEQEKSPLPPATLTSEITDQLGFERRLSVNRRADLTMISHFGFGIACSVLYALTARRIPASPLVKGGIFGLGVWASSYLGWIPTARLGASAFNMPQKRNALMILAHVVWGASLGFAENEMRKFGNQMLDGHRKAPQAE